MQRPTISIVHHRSAFASSFFRISNRRALVERLERRALLSTVVVNTVADVNDAVGGAVVSLRDAMAAANRSATPTTIQFDAKVFQTRQTITLAHGTLELTNAKQAITLVGPTAGVQISGNHAVQVFLIDAGVTASLANVSIINGLANTQVYAGDYGGGICNHGTLRVTYAAIANNGTTPDLSDANGGDGGGGIYSDGTLWLDHCTISGNAAGYAGGGIEIRGAATLTDCAIVANTSAAAGYGAAGIYNEGDLRMVGCTVRAIPVRPAPSSAVRAVVSSAAVPPR